ncbi:DNA-binding response OmpR family regulator [Zhihengliuella halotolerans]|uniref:DNA-binding response OmpR family regulator n=1 Tax=Zhihengliuella halotolerans TaxID=370736 RepID=A0A4Q8A9V2_9MICC|nr:DNA-binding response OmpR family regulator [Zhihengliuella halotolerans]
MRQYFLGRSDAAGEGHFGVGAPPRVRILVALADDELRTALLDLVQGENFSKIQATTGRTLVNVASRTRPSLIIMSSSYPDLHGQKAILRLRRFTNAYIVVIDFFADEDGRIALLRAGADQIVDGRLGHHELRARVRSMLRRLRWVPSAVDVVDEEDGTATTASDLDDEGADSVAGPLILVSDGVVLDARNHRCWVNDVEVRLSNTEHRLLLTLMYGHPDGTGNLFTRGELLAATCGVRTASAMDDKANRSLEVHMGNLRKKLGENVRDPRRIRTVHGVGYHWMKPVELKRD